MFGKDNPKLDDLEIKTDKDVSIFVTPPIRELTKKTPLVLEKKLFPTEKRLSITDKSAFKIEKKLEPMENKSVDSENKLSVVENIVDKNHFMLEKQGIELNFPKKITSLNNNGININDFKNGVKLPNGTTIPSGKLTIRFVPVGGVNMKNRTYTRPNILKR